MKQKMTPWFDGDVRPVHVGMYLRKYLDAVLFCRWNGRQWFLGYDGKNFDWAQKTKYTSHYQCLPWRGLSKEPT